MDIFGNPLFILSVLTFVIVLAEWLALNTICRHVGVALLVIVLAAVVANLGIIPSASDAPALYGGIFTYLAPLAILFLLLEVNLRNIRKAGMSMIIMFFAGALGTVLGVVIAIYLVGGRESMSASFHAIAGMFTGTYIGGSINFNAIALHYEVQRQGNLYGGAIAVDNIMTALWMVASLAIPKILNRYLPRDPGTTGEMETLESRATGTAEGSEALDPLAEFESDAEKMTPLDLAMMAMLGTAALWLANTTTVGLEQLGLAIPSILVLTTFGVILAQIPAIHHLKGNRLLGMFCVYMFLAVIGAFCELKALIDIGSLGLTLLLFASILVLVHGLVTFGLAALLRQGWELAAVASQTNIGGPATALALARGLGRYDLVLPAILVGSLGNVLGTYLGFMVAGILA